ncbi:tumor protein p53-inducible nuclear protein 1 isoform X2 [Leucoraja erinacea]|uniref:tumor protein p53-inducible nuclear protein 1 isoform X2 n=1 Tax=Leucoraja erinaceus TaxID=7782 RepID=UPI002455F045|nr:tumor protein p53-inducible nuclear protein 1 isoform X2 [Leucoraja erinacea]
MYQHLSSMLFGAIDCAENENREREICEKEDDEWILVDYIGGHAPIHVETSPLENLLIEHPSMSVYVAHNVRNNVSENGGSVEYETEAVRTAPPGGLDHHIRCYAATLAAHTDIVQQAAQLRHVRRGKEHCAKHLVNRNNIRRQNLNREYISRQTKHSGHTLHQPCQRQYNY